MLDEKLLDVSAWERADDRSNSDVLDEMAWQLRCHILAGTAPVGFLPALMRSDRANLREYAGFVASELGSTAEPILGDCIKALRDPIGEVRYYAALAVLASGDVGTDAAFLDIVNLLFDSVPLVQHIGVNVLRQISTDVYDRHSKAHDDIRPPLRDAVSCLELATAIGPHTVDELKVRLLHPDRGIRLAALVSALRIGQPAIEVISEALTHPDVRVRDVGASFAYLLGDSISPFLVEVLKRESDPTVTASVLSSLSRIADIELGDDRSMVFSRLGDSNDAVRFEAMALVRHVFPLNRGECNAVVGRLRDSSESVRAMAGIVLCNAATSIANHGLENSADELFSIALDFSTDLMTRGAALFVLGECPTETLETAIHSRQSEIIRVLREHDETVLSRMLYILSRCEDVPAGLRDEAKNLFTTCNSSEVKRMASRVSE